MAGAYVAKVAEAASSSVPSGWDLDWPFPGPAPPGYSFDLSFTVTGADSYVPASEYSATNTLYDHDTYETEEPSGSITWTATIDGSEVQLKKSGDSEFASSVTSDYSGIGDYWGAQPTLLFSVSAADAGSTIVLQASGDPITGETITATKNITVIVADEWYVIFECVISPTSAAEPPSPQERTWGTYLKFHDSSGTWVTPWGYLWGLYYHSHLGVEYWSYDHGADTTSDFGVYAPEDNGDAWILGTTDVGTLQIKALRLNSGVTYNVTHKHYATDTGGGGVTYSYSLKVYENDVLKSTTTKEVVKSDGDPADATVIWCTIDGDTGDVTEVNP